MSNQRDIQFVGFAEHELNQLTHALQSQGATMAARALIYNKKKLRLILAQCTYDLVSHILLHHEDIEHRPLARIDISEIADMVTLRNSEEATR